LAESYSGGIEQLAMHKLHSRYRQRWTVTAREPAVGRRLKLSMVRTASRQLIRFGNLTFAASDSGFSCVGAVSAEQETSICEEKMVRIAGLEPALAGSAGLLSAAE